MSDGNPTVPEIRKGTLTLNDYNSMHTKFLLKLYINSVLKRLLRSMLSYNYICIVTYLPDMLRTFFYRKTISICNRPTNKVLILTNTIERL